VTSEPTGEPKNDNAIAAALVLPASWAFNSSGVLMKALTVRAIETNVR
jgi:hypothetical protein